MVKLRDCFAQPRHSRTSTVYIYNLHVDSFLCKMEFIQTLQIQWSSCSSFISEIIVLLVAICQQSGSQDHLIVISCSSVIWKILFQWLDCQLSWTEQTYCATHSQSHESHHVHYGRFWKMLFLDMKFWQKTMKRKLNISWACLATVKNQCHCWFICVFYSGLLKIYFLAFFCAFSPKDI